MNYLLFLALLVVSKTELLEDTLDGTLLKKGIQQFSETGIKPSYLGNIAKNHPLEFGYHGQISLKNISDMTECGICDVIMTSVVDLRKKEIPEGFIEELVIEICLLLHMEDKRVCHGVIDPFADIMVYIVDNGKDVTAEKLCNLFVGSKCHDQFAYFNWTIPIPEKLSIVRKELKTEPNKLQKNLRILQLTDLHYDPNYGAGNKAICNEPICCQKDQGKPDDPSQACGVWGDYTAADTPNRTLNEALRHMKTQNVDYVYFTGDIVSHRVWSTSEEANSQQEREFMDLMRNNFDVPVFFVLGNHEPHPLNSYAPLSVTDEDLSSQWIFDQLEDELKGVVPKEELENIRNGGYYTVVLKPGFRIIVLNNNVCFTLNLWLAYEDYDPYGQLKWLVNVLVQAEKDGEHVHILHHIPSGDKECLGVWGREYSKIINRFSDTVTGQFNGHTHFDEFFLYFNESEPEQAINVAHNGASLTTFTNNNPSYKIYEVDSNTFEVLDVEEWTFNLTEANLHPERPTVDWYKLYSFKEAYGLESLKPEVLGDLVVEMTKNETIFQVYNKYRYRMGNGIESECDDNCQKEILCRIVTSNLADTEHCEEIKRIFDEHRS